MKQSRLELLIYNFFLRTFTRSRVGRSGIRQDVGCSQACSILLKFIHDSAAGKLYRAEVNPPAGTGSTGRGLNIRQAALFSA